MKYYKGNIEKLPLEGVFVFGANLQYKHGAGAARTALDKFGAVWGKGRLQGQSYALPTKHTPYKGMSLEQISHHIEEFISFAHSNSNLTFYLTDIGCGLAGHKAEEITSLLRVIPENVIISERFYKLLNEK